MAKFYCFCLFLTYFLYGYDTLETNTLTTATIRQSTSPQPRPLVRRANLDDDKLSDTSDVQKDADARSRKTTSVWNWDSLCRLQVRKGKCGKQLKRFYYNIATNECSPFYFGGCDGNENNFKTVLECERHCKNSYVQSVDISPRINRCHLQPESGMCLAIIKSYYYDVNEKKCKSFTYGGCGGNTNRFMTKVSCIEACGKSSD